MVPASQRDAAAFLTALAGHKPVHTHISAVFVGQDKAWKLKKAVTLPFLDFAPPAARKHFVQHEFTLNRPMAPDIYLAVRGLARAPDGKLHFCAQDAPEAEEWVLEMAKIPAGNFLDEIAAKGGITEAMCRDLGDMVARLHETAPAAQPENETGRVAHLIESVAANAQESGLEHARVKHWHDLMHRQLRAQVDLITSRADSGRVRRVHGDLHLGNLCLWHGAVLPFDALEFDEDLATIDTAYDFAFLLMDLDLRAGRLAASRVFNRYLARSGDFSLLPLLPLFLSLRAMIRAQIRALQKDPESETYLRLALAALHPVSSPVVAIGGLQGTGKSTLARALAPKLGPAPGALVLRSDELRKHQHKMAPETRLPESAYSPAANAALNAALCAIASKAASSGHGLIIDASFLNQDLREAMEHTIKATGRAWLGLWLEAPLPVLTTRLAQRQGDASDANAAVLRAAAAQDHGPITWHRLDATHRERLVREARALIRATEP
jgi:uncharacterized protein